MSPHDADRNVTARVLACMLVLGGLAALAVAPMVMPFAWMQQANDWLGLAPLDRTPLTEYLTRSLAAMYALAGATLLYLARDVRRYADLIVFAGWLTVALGVALTGIDAVAGLPPLWFWTEGPPTAACGVAIVWLARRVRAAPA
jgi:hypothetical protein